MLKKAVETPKEKGTRPTLEKCLAAFDDYLRLQNLRMTAPRQRLVEKIYTIHDHFDADDLFVELRKKDKAASRATIYRTLELMAAAGLVKKTSFIENKSYYEYAYGHDHHDHLICNSCGKIVEFRDDVIEKRQGSICQKFGFVMACHSHKIYGVCPACRRKGGRRA